MPNRAPDAVEFGSSVFVPRSWIEDLPVCVFLFALFPHLGERIMKLMALALTAAVASSASATFVSYVVTKTQTSNSGVALDVYTVWARFNGSTDTVLNAFNFNRLDSSNTNVFYHKDLDSLSSGVLTKSGGTWAPQLTGNATANRPFDSFLVIGGNANGANSTNADPSWTLAPNGDARGWNRPDVPNGQNVGWFNSSPPNLQGRVGSPGNTATDVRLGQFVIDRDTFGGTWNLKVGYNSGVAGAPVQFAESTFDLGVIPAPGAMALLGLAGLAGRRRR
jgi:hypothetical protein